MPAAHLRGSLACLTLPHGLPACLYCRRLDSPDIMTSAKLIERIVENRTQFEARQAKKQKSESEYYKTSKTYLQEI